MIISTIKPFKASDKIELPTITKTLNYQIVIIGAGAAGITTASLLFNQNHSLDIAIIDPSDQHYYQPGWTLTGGGVFRIQDTVRNQRDVIPQDATWIKDKVIHLDPDHNQVLTEAGFLIRYDYLIVCPGIQIDWHLISGLKEALGKEGVTTNYSPQYAPYTWEVIRNFKGGNALFTLPKTPIKCGGAPQKVMYMADDTFRSRWGVRQRTNVMFFSPGNRMFSVPEYSHLLENVIKERNIKVQFRHNLKAIIAETKTAIFEILDNNCQVIDQVSYPYDMIHVAPPQSAPDFIKHSPLAVPNNPYGWVDVDADTLQHKRYPNVFSLGDASSLPTSKTAAAVRKQAPVVAKNLLSLMASKPLISQYDGYTCCPLITGYDRTIMAEFNGYNATVLSSFPLNPAKERAIMWTMKVTALPWIYWNRMLKGDQFEGEYIKFMQWKKK